jgi:uncharacterized membrane protein (UPF0127 family)
VIVRNAARNTTLGEAIEVAATSAQRVRGLLGRECLEDGQGLLFKNCGSLHTFFMTFPIDVIYADRKSKVLKVAAGVKPFKLIAAPMRAFYAIELPEGAIERSQTQAGDTLILDEEVQILPQDDPVDVKQNYAA